MMLEGGRKMVKHVVMWNLKDNAEGVSKEENIAKLKKELLDLKEKIAEIIVIEVGVNFNSSDAAYDVVLYSEFESKEALATYQKHPDHVKVAQFVGQIVEERVVVDYDV